MIGRRDGSTTSDVDLAPDEWVSRRHAHVWYDSGEWWIEDVGTSGAGSTHGTRVDGKEIKGRTTATRLDLWAEIQVGQSVLMLAPPDWRRWRAGDLVIEVTALPVINFSVVHCGIAIVSRVVARNWGTRRSTPSTLALEIPGYTTRLRIDLDGMAPGESRTWHRPDLPVDARAIEGIGERHRRRLAISADGRPLLGAALDCWMLPHHEWSFDPAHRVTLASFVLRGHPLVTQIHAAVAPALLHHGGVAVTCRAVYEHLRTSWRLKWVAECANELPGERPTGQKVSLPHMMLEQNGRTGIGTCLDFALLLAACLERAGLQPLLAILDAGATRHALVGCWPAARPPLEPLPRGIDIARRALWIEPTGCAVGPNGEATIEFDAARERAMQCLAEAPLEFVVDIAAARQDGIRPLPFTGELIWAPDARRVLALAQGLADETGASQSIQVLLLALLSQERSATHSVFALCGRDIDDDRRRLRSMLRPDGQPGTPTVNFERALGDAVAHAKQARSALVREVDLLAALVTTSSRAFAAALMRLELPRDDLTRAVRVVARSADAEPREVGTETELPP